MSRPIYFLDRSGSIWFLVTSLCLRGFQAGEKAEAMEWNEDESVLLRCREESSLSGRMSLHMLWVEVTLVSECSGTRGLSYL